MTIASSIAFFIIANKNSEFAVENKLFLGKSFKVLSLDFIFTAYKFIYTKLLFFQFYTRFSLLHYIVFATPNVYTASFQPNK